MHFDVLKLHLPSQLLFTKAQDTTNVSTNDINVGEEAWVKGIEGNIAAVKENRKHALHAEARQTSCTCKIGCTQYLIAANLDSTDQRENGGDIFDVNKNAASMWDEVK